MEKSDAVLEQVIIEVLVQMQQHVQEGIVDSQFKINQSDLHIILLVTVLNQVSSSNQPVRNFHMLIIVMSLIDHFIALPVDQFSLVLLFD